MNKRMPTEQEMETFVSAANAAPQGNKAITVPSGAGLIPPSSGSLPNTSGPAGAAPLTTETLDGRRSLPAGALDDGSPDHGVRGETTAGAAAGRPTPRTDAVVGEFDFPWSYQMEMLVRHAEKLERELDAAHCELKDLRRQMRNLRA